jgi:glutathione S-transferase
MYKLIIGNKNYSSWSLRPWLLMKYHSIPFDEIKIPLYAETSKQQLLQYSAAGKVPVLQTGEHNIWDSLAICETIAERHPDKFCWPQNPHKRALAALARAICSEMHSGFMALRSALPMNCRKSMVFSDTSLALRTDIERVCALWRECLATSSGPFLFTDFSIADAFYAPVVLRFISYGIKVGDVEAQYMQTILSLGSVQEWIAKARAEPGTISEAEID